MSIKTGIKLSKKYGGIPLSKEELLMTMTEIVGRVRRDSSEKSVNKAKKGCRKPDTNETSAKFKKKMTPLAESTLCLLLREGDMNQNTIARHMYVSAQAISELMKKFETRELITRISGEYNNANIIRLTELGEETAKEYAANSKKVAENIFQHFTEEELAIFTLLLNKAKEEKVD